ncbi:MAG: glycosyltransferase family protein [Verrucomicrobiota bacterium]
MKKVVFLESVEGVESLFTRGLRHGAVKAGWNTSICFLRDKEEEFFRVEELKRKIRGENPDVICFLMDAPLPLRDLWEGGLEAFPKISLWYDDFLRSPHTLENPRRWTQWQKEQNVRVFIWDGYWRKEWKKLTEADAFETHLAADPSQLNENAEPIFPELNDFAVMTGTLPSLVSLQKELMALPAPVRKIVQECAVLLEKDTWPIQPYACAGFVLGRLSAKLKHAAETWLSAPINRAVFYHQIWRWGKRSARLRGLRALAEVSPVAVLSGHRTENFAGEEELRACLPKNAHFEFRDTTKISSEQWSGIFRSGKFQIQFTDPQSIKGGIPFRVFECAACAVPLLSDSRPELSKLFPSLITADTEQSLAQKAATISKDEFLVSACESHKTFLEKHTWEARWKELVEG